VAGGCSKRRLLIFSIVILFHVVPLQQRPIYQGMFGAVFAIGSVIGPLMGGAFTDNVSWRWCFYINLPIGAVSIAVIILFLHLPNQTLDAAGVGFMAKVKQLDPIGNLVFFPGIVCLVSFTEVKDWQVTDHCRFSPFNGAAQSTTGPTRASSSCWSSSSY
jgi:MFS family permease